MRLQDWTILLSAEPANPGAMADIRCATGRKVATVRLSEEFSGFDAEEKRHALTHELIHPHMHMVLSACHDLRPMLGDPTWKVWMDRVVEGLEYGVDGLADAFDPALPTVEAAAATGVLDGVGVVETFADPTSSDGSAVARGVKALNARLSRRTVE